MTITQAAAQLRRKEISCVELVEESLRRIRDDKTNSFITVTDEQALDEARFMDIELRAGRDRGPLHGIPIALKDLYYTAGVKTTNGSKLFADFVPAFDATVVRKLEAAGAISVGKLNQHELAYGITSGNPHYGAVRNPHDLDRIPGGSSGGSGAAVASELVFVGMGSDTGGSIRIPAAYCGVVGLKPTFGRVSRHGCFQLGLTLDHMGPLTRSVADSAIVLNAIAGADPNDEGTVERRQENFVPAEPAFLSGIRIGVPENFYRRSLDAEVYESYRNVLAIAERLQAEIVPVQAPEPAALNAIARTILLCEASAVLTPYYARRSEFGDDVLSLIDQGRMLPATDYINAQRVRRQMQREWSRMFERVDCVVTPTTPIPAPPIGVRTVSIEGDEEDTRLASTRLVRGVNVLGLPAISIPCGKTKAGLPIGLQIIGRAWQERRLLEWAAAWEENLA